MSSVTDLPKSYAELMDIWLSITVPSHTLFDLLGHLVQIVDGAYLPLLAQSVDLYDRIDAGPNSTVICNAATSLRSAFVKRQGRLAKVGQLLS
jgi:hypothetical protein